MKRVCADENLHQLFYRDLAAAAFEAAPSEMMIALEAQVRKFAMPGTGIPDFDRHAALIAKAGIYDLQIHHDQILVPVVLRQWDAANMSGLSGGRRRAGRLMKRLATSAKVAKRFADKRDAALQPPDTRGNRRRSNAWRISSDASEPDVARSGVDHLGTRLAAGR